MVHILVSTWPGQNCNSGRSSDCVHLYDEDDGTVLCVFDEPILKRCGILSFWVYVIRGKIGNIDQHEWTLKHRGSNILSGHTPGRLTYTKINKDLLNARGCTFLRHFRRTSLRLNTRNIVRKETEPRLITSIPQKIELTWIATTEFLWVLFGSIIFVTLFTLM